MVQQIHPPTEDWEWLYPESDGQPLADNTIQFQLIMKIQGGLDALFANDPNVFVAGDLLWYPVERSSVRMAPDVMVVWGRPKGDRRSYRQWQEDHIPPQVVFEILSPSNTASEMEAKLDFYQKYGVEEYYLYDPDTNQLQGWLRRGAQLLPIVNVEGWVSPRLDCRLVTTAGTLDLYRPDGQRFQSFVETVQWAEQQAQRAEQEAQRAEREAQRAEREAQRAEREAQRAEREAQRAEREAQRAERETQTRLAAIPKLLAMGLMPEQIAQVLNCTVEEVIAGVTLDDRPE